MNNQILTDNTVIYYVVRVNGQDMSVPFSSAQMAEMEKAKLPPDTQMIAEVVPVTSDGKELLLG
jgi:hypothetical protein